MLLKRYLPVLIAILALLLLTPLKLEFFTFRPTGAQAGLVSQPAWPAISTARVIPQIVSADLNADGQPENLRLEDGRVQIMQDSQAAWRSPADWQVTQALIGDLDGDGRPEVDLLVWRPFRPWPVDRFLPYGGRIDVFQDSQGRSCHLILIAWRDGAFRERWAGSALAEPLRSFAAVDLDGDGRQELVALETAYDDPPSSPARALSVWSWNGFGFSLLARQNGPFRQLAVYASPVLEPFLLLQR
ncbi:MAG: VCBS repeat-containing protein [Anaerolineales bacterium]|jgi:hypothetical protein